MCYHLSPDALVHVSDEGPHVREEVGPIRLQEHVDCLLLLPYHRHQRSTELTSWLHKQGRDILTIVTIAVVMVNYGARSDKLSRLERRLQIQG